MTVKIFMIKSGNLQNMSFIPAKLKRCTSITLVILKKQKSFFKMKKNANPSVFLLVQYQMLWNVQCLQKLSMKIVGKISLTGKNCKASNYRYWRG